MPFHSDIDPNIVKAYKQTEYKLLYKQDITILIDQHIPKLDLIFHELNHISGAIITACNPRSILLSPIENQHRMTFLSAQIERASYLYLPVFGRDPNQIWPGEESYLIFGLKDNEAQNWCYHFGQNAYVFCEKGKASRLVLQN